jgi:hypothetical protein
MPAPSGEEQAEADAPFDVIVIGFSRRGQSSTCGSSPSMGDLDKLSPRNDRRNARPNALRAQDSVVAAGGLK